MFKKEFRVKSNSAMKASEKKKLVNDLKSCFYPDSSSKILTVKENINHVKIVTSSEANINVYVVDKNPVIFEVDGLYAPSVYTLWKIPSLVYNFVIHPETLNHLMNGADLMLPGLVIVGDITITSFGMLSKGDVCSISLSNNKAPVAVGITAMSSEDMYLSGKRGKGIKILHIYQDNLWKFGSRTKIPHIEPVLTKTPIESIEPLKTDIEDQVALLNIAGVEDSVESSDVSQLKSTPLTMEYMLHVSFMAAMKFHGKKIEFPILLSTFYKNYVLCSCPYSTVLDVKKTVHKKLSKFIEQYISIGLITTAELSKGVISITNIVIGHPDLKLFVTPESEVIKEDTPESLEEEFAPPNITSLYCVTSAVVPLLKLYNYSKGSTVSSIELRRVITDYVKQNQLQNPENPRLVMIDDLIGTIVKKNQDCISWEDLVSNCLGQMTEVFKIVYSDDKTVISKKKSPKIRIDVQTRSGNKKVTLISGLEDFGFDLKDIGKVIQKGIAASTSIGKNAENNSVLTVQGDQRKYLKKLLTEQYKIQLRFLPGLEKVK